MNSAMLGAIAATIAVPIFMALVSKAFPPNVPARAQASLASAAIDFEKWEQRINLLLFAMWLPTTVLIWLPLHALSGVVASLLGPADFRITPDALVWVVTALIPALLVAVVPTEWIAKRLLGPQYDHYQTYYALKHGIDNARVMRFLGMSLGGLSSVMVVLGLNWYVLIRADVIIINPYFSFTETVHSYSDIELIQTAPQLIAPNGKIVRRREFLVIFNDATSWSTDHLPAAMGEDEKRIMIELISERAAVPIEELQTFARGAL